MSLAAMLAAKKSQMGVEEEDAEQSGGYGNAPNYGGAPSSYSQPGAGRGGLPPPPPPAFGGATDYSQNYSSSGGGYGSGGNDYNGYGSVANQNAAHGYSGSNYASGGHNYQQSNDSYDNNASNSYNQPSGGEQYSTSGGYNSAGLMRSQTMPHDHSDAAQIPLSPNPHPMTPSGSSGTQLSHSQTMGPLMASLRPLPQRSNSVPTHSSSSPYASIAQPNTEMEGYMQKEGGGYKSWKKRYFVLKNNKIEYYADEKGGKRTKKGEVNIADIREVKASIKSRVPHCMDIVTGKRTYKFGCINEADKQDWMAAIQSWLPKR